MKELSGYHGVILEIDLASGKIDKKPLSPEDARKSIGGRGLGMKILWDRLKKPGLNPLSPENPLIFMTGPFSGLPVPSASRACVVTKSPHTSPIKSKYKFASTISYANVGGFIGPEIRFAGYDGIVISGKASSPVYLVIEDDRVEFREAKKFWGLKTEEFDRKLTEELGDRRFKTCYIGPAGENLVEYAAILHTAARAAGRGGTGCVMGSKNLKAIAIRGTRVPPVADHKRFISLLDEARQGFKGAALTESWRRYGTASSIVTSSAASTQAVKNYWEGTFQEAAKISGIAAEQKIWVRDLACFAAYWPAKNQGW
ncbi:MAG: aldehyde ferredoxin oxidoreductase N-terminal domain-containing protein [Acidobacteriota bacterium]|nr:aldehyde ferredoxin oxidoreductase N-terminal domain-containing protein [Acidobacteriota bacterium]